jgi:3D (Asp-Asp-Asp) domain-containing protein
LIEGVTPMHAVVLAWFLATAYCHGGKTSSGADAKAGVIAADRHVLKAGSRVRIVDGRSSGVYTVLDTGHRIRGRKVDIFIPSCHRAKRFGRRRVAITVLR